MAFEYGLLGYSAGRSPAGELGALLGAIGADLPGIVREEIKEGDGWASVRFRSSAPEGESRQTVQVNVGGEIVDIFIKQARNIISDEILAGRDLMVIVSVSGSMGIDDRIVEYARSQWRGIPWDEVSGFETSFDR